MFGVLALVDIPVAVQVVPHSQKAEDCKAHSKPKSAFAGAPSY